MHMKAVYPFNYSSMTVLVVIMLLNVQCKSYHSKNVSTKRAELEPLELREYDDRIAYEEGMILEETEPPSENDEIFTIVEEMPLFGGCKDEQCSNQKVAEFIGERLRYPPIAREQNVEGTVIVSFVIDENGSVTDVRPIRDIGYGCGDEAVRVIKSLPNWKAGTQRGKNVRVKMHLPLRFSLD